MQSLEYIDEVMSLEGDTVAAVVVEPIVGSSGDVLVPPAGYLPRLKDIAHDHGALIIADEVMTGFGRSDDWFACNRFGIDPDILTMAKGLTGSYAPLGATIVSGEIAEYFEDQPFAHGHTFSGHPVSCAAGLAAIETYEKSTSSLVPEKLESILVIESRTSLGIIRAWGRSVVRTLLRY